MFILFENTHTFCHLHLRKSLVKKYISETNVFYNVYYKSFVRFILDKRYAAIIQPLFYFIAFAPILILSFNLPNFVDAFGIKREIHLLTFSALVGVILQLILQVCNGIFHEQQLIWMLVSLAGTGSLFVFAMIQNYWVLRQIIIVYEFKKFAACVENGNEKKANIQLSLMRHITVCCIFFL